MARCPGCGSFSGWLHGSYLRFPAALPVAGRRAVLRLRVRRLAPAPAESATPWPTGHRFPDRTHAKHATVHALLTTGHSRRSIQRQLGMSYRTVRPEDLFQGQCSGGTAGPSSVTSSPACTSDGPRAARTPGSSRKRSRCTATAPVAAACRSTAHYVCRTHPSCIGRGSARHRTAPRAARRPACSRPARVDHRSAPVHQRLIRRPRGCRAPGFACRVSRRSPYTK
ncbi:transposase family protein [Streptomyces nigra]|uniref:transposase family protein n=1 Tax=Streptomyces nigra TaxID=1827580 RepID=UPI003664674D